MFLLISAFNPHLYTHTIFCLFNLIFQTLPDPKILIFFSPFSQNKLGIIAMMQYCHAYLNSTDYTVNTGKDYVYIVTGICSMTTTEQSLKTRLIYTWINEWSMCEKEWERKRGRRAEITYYIRKVLYNKLILRFFEITNIFM